MKFHSLIPLAHVADVTRSIEFYGRLGFVVGSTHAPERSPSPVWASLENGGARLMVALADEQVVRERQGVLFYAYCDDVAGCRDALLAAGVEAGPIHQPFYNPRGEFPVVDPDGYVVMITHT